MNRNQLRKLGVPEDSINVCLTTFRDSCMTKVIKKNAAKRDIPLILESPQAYTTDPVWGSFALSLIAEKVAEAEDAKHTPVSYKEWGCNLIDDNARSQMSLACELPCVVFAALAPDCHYGYSVPIGAILATEDKVLPSAIGFDISCGMRLSILDKSPETIDSEFERYRLAIERATLFGAGKKWQNKKYHPVLDHQDWRSTKLLAGLRDKAWEQLGTSGSSNHFCDIGVIDIPNEYAAQKLGTPSGKYVAILTHSGSRNPGKSVCDYYNKIAYDRLSKRHQERFKQLAWLDLNSDAGQEYWIAMHLMGEFAAANHEVIHRDMTKEIDATVLGHVANAHNYAWSENHYGKDVIVHRKGATPAGEGILGVIPGSMGSSCFVVCGKGNPDSLRSASHGAGRKMSRKEAKAKFNWKHVKAELDRRNIVLLHGGLDESPDAYKDIHEVMKAQSDLVDVIAKFDPRIVEMDSDHDKDNV